MLPTVAGTTGVHHYTQLFFCWNMVSQTFLPGLTWNHDPPNFSLPRSLGWQCVLLYQAIGWDGVLLTFCLGWSWTAILLISATQVAKISAMGIWWKECVNQITRKLCQWCSEKNCLYTTPGLTLIYSRPQPTMNFSTIKQFSQDLIMSGLITLEVLSWENKWKINSLKQP
jgi:hypothetical protein